MADYSETFSTDPFASRWGHLYNTMTWVGSAYVLCPSGGANTYFGTDIVDTAQYVKVQHTDASPSGGAVFRSTGTGSDNYYQVYRSAISGNVFFEVSNESGYLEEVDNGGTFTIAQNDYTGATCVGTGTATTIRVWLNPSNDVPYDAENWDSSSDPPDVTMDASGGISNPCDSGTYIGVGSYSINDSYDNWHGGSTTDPSVVIAGYTMQGRYLLEARSDGTT